MKMYFRYILLFSILVSCVSRDIDLSEEELLELKRQAIISHSLLSLTDLQLYYSQGDSTCSCEIMPYLIANLDSNQDNYLLFECYIKSKFKNRYEISLLDSLEQYEKEYLVSVIMNGAKSGEGYSQSLLIKLYEKGIYFKKSQIKSDSIFKVAYGRLR